MGPKTTPSLISKGGYQIPPPLGGREIDTPWEIGLIDQPISQTGNTVCLKGQVKIYLLITRARKHSKTLERWHFLH